jgi:hypothetical protein
MEHKMKKFGIDNFLAIFFVLVVGLFVWIVYSMSSDCYQKSADKSTIGAIQCVLDTLDELDVDDD